MNAGIEGLRTDMKADNQQLMAVVAGVPRVSRSLGVAVKADMKAGFEGLRADMKAGNEDLRAEMKANNQRLMAVWAGVPRASRSLGVAVQQVATDRPVTAFAAATPAQVVALLKANGFGQYATALGHLSGAEAMMQTEASLRLLGVIDGDAKPLLELLQAAVRAAGLLRIK